MIVLIMRVSYSKNLLDSFSLSGFIDTYNLQAGQIHKTEIFEQTLNDFRIIYIKKHAT